MDEQTKNLILDQFERLTAQERDELFQELRSLYCIHCGDEQSKWGRGCQCQNDD